MLGHLTNYLRFYEAKSSYLGANHYKLKRCGCMYFKFLLFIDSMCKLQYVTNDIESI